GRGPGAGRSDPPPARHRSGLQRRGRFRGAGWLGRTAGGRDRDARQHGGAHCAHRLDADAPADRQAKPGLARPRPGARMNVLSLQIFITLMLGAGAVALFVFTVRSRTLEHSARLSLAPLEEDVGDSAAAPAVAAPEEEKP